MHVFADIQNMNILYREVHSWNKKGCYTPIRGNEIDMAQISVLPVGCNWHKMYLWLLPNEIQPYFDWTFTSMPSWIIKVQNHSLGGHFPEICLCTVESSNQPLHIFFWILTDCSDNIPSNTYRF